MPPSDNVAALLAAGEQAGASGADLLLAMAVSDQVQGRLMAALPTMRAGLNDTTPSSYSVATGAARRLGLDAERTAHALALAGVSSVSLAVIQAEPLSNRKGLTSGETASRALLDTMIAGRGVTGTLGVFGGPFESKLLAGCKSVRWKLVWNSLKIDMPFRGTITDSAPPQLRHVLRRTLKTTQLGGADEIAPLNIDPRIEQERGVSHVFSNTKTMLDR